MGLKEQIYLRQNPKLYNYLKENSAYFKEFNRGLIDGKTFEKNMKIKYKERVTDKLSSAAENMELISSVLDILK